MGADLRTIIEGILEGEGDIAFKTSAILNAIYDAEEQRGRRDMFAAMAMQGILSRGNMYEERELVNRSVSHADRLIAELDKKDKAE